MGARFSWPRQGTLLLLMAVLLAAPVFGQLPQNVRVNCLRGRGDPNMLYEWNGDGTVSSLPIITAVPKMTSSGPRLKNILEEVKCPVVAKILASRRGREVRCFVDENKQPRFSVRLSPQEALSLQMPALPASLLFSPSAGNRTSTKGKWSATPQSQPQGGPIPRTSQRVLPRGCPLHVDLSECCNDQNRLKTTPWWLTLYKHPWTNVVRLFFKRTFRNGMSTQSSCTGTMIERRMVLTAAHCVPDGPANAINGFADFKVYLSKPYAPRVRIAGWAMNQDWITYRDSPSDQAIMVLDPFKAQSSYKRVLRADYLNTGRRNTSHQLLSIGFPDLPGPNPNKYSDNPQACLNVRVPAANGRVSTGRLFYLRLEIRPAMSGGPVFDKATMRLIATNDVTQDVSGCARPCYNGYTPIDNRTYPVDVLISGARQCL